MTTTLNKRHRTGANDVTLAPVPAEQPEVAAHDMPKPSLSIREALSRCMVAARKAMRGERFSHTDHVDCAADLLARLIVEYMERMEQDPLSRCRRCGAPSKHMATLEADVPGVLATVPLCHRHAIPAIARRPINVDTEGVPREALPMYRLVGMANNWRVSEDRYDARQLRAAADAVTFSLPPSQRRSAGGKGTTRHTVEMLSDLGLLGDLNAYLAVYTLTRELDGLSREEIAREIGMERESLNTVCKRFKSRVPSAKVRTKGQHEDALSASDWHTPASYRVPTDPTQTNGQEDPRAWRDRQPAQTPLTITYGPATADAWNGKDTAWWAHSVTPSMRAPIMHRSQAGGLAYSARMQRTRKEGADALLLNEKRAANGLPPMS